MRDSIVIPKANSGWCAFFVTALVILAATLATTHAATARPPTDREIDAAIEQRLLSDPEAPGHAIDAEVKDAVVTLTGSVDHLLARDRASHIADWCGESITNAFLTDSAVESYEVRPEVTRGAVVLKGRV